MASPEFSLAACPRCSSDVGGLCQPFWKYAHNTSAKRGHNCYFWLGGCAHARAVAPGDQIFDEPSDWARIESAWRAAADALFIEVTARWTVGQRERWAAQLASKQHVDGVDRSLDLSPETPAQQNTNQPNTTNG